MNRREFLMFGSAAAAAAALPSGAQAADAKKARGPERLRLGILSDIHIQTEACITTRFLPELEYFRDREVDGVLIAGDLCDWGWKGQLKWVADAWKKTFPDGKLPNGNPVEQLFIYGNHDIEGYRYGYPNWEPKMPDDWQVNAIGRDRNRAKFWEELFGEKWAPIMYKDVKGYKFVLANYGGWRTGYFAETVGLREFLAEHDAELRGPKPFFYAQHLLLRDTSTAPWCRWVDNGVNTKTLSAYPNCVAVTGHTHLGLADDRNLWRGAFTEIAAGSTWTQHCYGGRENSALPAGDSLSLAAQTQMPDMEIMGQPGLVLHVYDDALVFERYDFLSRGKIAADLVVPWPPKPATEEERAAETPVPEFPKGAKVTFRGVHGKDRQGTPTDQVVVTFPTVGPASPRAFDYEVTAEVLCYGAQYGWRTKRVFSKGFQLSAEADVEPVDCVFAVHELPPASKPLSPEQGYRFRFVVSPVNSLGGKGRPIVSDWTSVEKVRFP